MKIICLLVLSNLLVFAAHAEVVEATPDHYLLNHEAVSVLSHHDMWERLTSPSLWWNPDHTYSGDSANLTLELHAGGLWREDWADGSVAHGTVLSVSNGRQLRLAAPFGPLQEMAVETIWTITVVAEGEGSRVTFVEFTSGNASSNLDEIAPAVDFVKGEALRRLVADM